MKEFFTFSTLGTLAGATAVIIVVTNTVRVVTKIWSPIIPLLISMGVTFATAFAASSLSAWPDWLLAFFNGCLLFRTATGAQSTLIAGAEGSPISAVPLPQAWKQGMILAALGLVLAGFSRNRLTRVLPKHDC